MGISIRPSRALFSAVMIGLGIIGLIYGNSALIWEPIPKTLPDRPVIIYLCAVIEIGTGIGLLLRPSVILACRVLFPFLLLWMARITDGRSEEHTSELQSHSDIVCRLLLEKKNNVL